MKKEDSKKRISATGWDCEETIYGIAFCPKCGAYYDAVCVKKWKYCPMCGDKKEVKDANE